MISSSIMCITTITITVTVIITVYITIMISSSIICLFIFYDVLLVRLIVEFK